MVSWPHLSLPSLVRGQRLLSGPWVPGSGGVSGQALAVAPDGKLLFSGGHWDGSLCVTTLPRGKLLSQINRHLGMSALRLGRGGAGHVPEAGQERRDDSVLPGPPRPTQT